MGWHVGDEEASHHKSLFQCSKASPLCEHWKKRRKVGRELSFTTFVPVDLEADGCRDVAPC